MAHYILSGGFPWTAPENGRDLCRTMYSLLPPGITQARLLICLFSQPPAVWAEKIQAPLSMLRAHIPEGLNVEVTIADPYNFLEQIAEADIIYFNGGFTPLLVKALASYSLKASEWRERFGEKIIVGSSAGVGALPLFSVNVASEVPQEGLGVLEIATLVHYNSASYQTTDSQPVDWDRVTTAFIAGCEERGIPEKNQLRIPEADFIVYS